MMYVAVKYTTPAPQWSGPRPPNPKSSLFYLFRFSHPQNPTTPSPTIAPINIKPPPIP